MKKIITNNVFLLKKINEYSRSYFFVIILVSLTSLAGPLTTVLIPKLITDSLLNKESFENIFQLVFMAVSVNVIRIVAKTVFNEVYVPYNQNKIRCGINVLVMEKAKKLELKCYDDPEFYNKYTRALSQADSGLISFVDNFSALIDRFFYITTVIAIIATLEPVLILLASVCVMTLFYFSKKTAKYRYETSVLTTEYSRRADYSKRIHYLPEYAKEIRLQGLSELLVEKYISSNKINRSMTIKRSKRALGLILADEGIRILVLQFTSMLYLACRIQQGKLDVSSFVTLFMATMQFSFEVFNFVNCFNGFYKLSLYTDDLTYILQYQSDIESTSEMDSNKMKGIKSITVNDVDFSYDGIRNVLDNINIKISKGEHIALVGYNGAGKTTLTKLLLRLYDPDKGQIIINGENVKNIDINMYRDLFGVVHQDYHFYALTIAENILLKKIETDEERDKVIKALKMSRLYEDIKSLPNGIDTILTKEFSDDGVVLSGGQAQKLALARVFAQEEKEVFILDEASSAMDPISESKINKSIIDFCKNKTLILISHRLSICKDMDRIYVFEDGKIVESGSHSQLLEKGGVYSKMYSVQAENYK